MTVPWRELLSGVLSLPALPTRRSAAMTLAGASIGRPVPAVLADAPGPELKIGAGCFRFCGKYVNLQVISVV